MEPNARLAKIWIGTDPGVDIYNISLRTKTSKEVTGVPQLVTNMTVLPPLGAKINLDKAREDKLQQDHYTIFGMTREDLYQLYKAIEAKLQEEV